MLHRVLVVGDVANGVNPSSEYGSLCGSRTHTKVVDDGRIDPDHAGLAVDLIRVHGHEIHPHWRLAGLIPPVVRIHRGDPVQDFPTAVIGGRHGARVGTVQHAAGQEGDGDGYQESGSNR